MSYRPERAAAADLSDGYYTLNQSIVALKANGLAAVTSIAGLKGFRFGAQVGTTSLDTITDVDRADGRGKVYTTNDDGHRGAQGQADRRPRRRPADRVLRDRRPGRRLG